MNGDSFLELNLGELLGFHRLKSAVVSMAVRRVPDAARYGTVQLAENSRVSGFREKDGAQIPGLINGGVYVFSQPMLAHIPDGPASLEKEIFPGLLRHGVYALEQRGMFIDIGTPEDYARAQGLYQQLCLAARSQAS
jgi:NDP-sugar pyrophosphorylase family protein